MEEPFQAFFSQRQPNMDELRVTAEPTTLGFFVPC